MGRTVPSSSAVISTFQKIPKFGGLQKDERARLSAFEFRVRKDGSYGPWTEWIHNLEAPAVTEERDGQTITLRDRKWFGTYICPGDGAVLVDKGRDEARCPACEMAHEHDAFRATRRHVTNVIVYGTKAGTFDLREPWSVEVLPWAFSEKYFARLTELFEEYDEDLSKHDLRITCENKNFQRYQIDAAQEAFWSSPKYQGHAKWGNLKDMVAEALNSRLSDAQLQSVLGASVAVPTIKIKAVELAHALGLGSAGVAIPGADLPEPTSAEDIQAMLGGGASPAEEANEPSEDDAPAAPKARRSRAKKSEDVPDDPTDDNEAPAAAVDPPAEEPVPEVDLDDLFD